MDELCSDSYFDNIQLVKLVSSAEALFQHLYDLVSHENKQFIDQWLCFKQEYDSCSSTKLDINLEKNCNLVNDEIIRDDDQKSYYSDESYQSSFQETTTENEDQSSDTTSDRNLQSSGFESGSQNMLEQYSKNFQMYTDSLVSGWLRDLNLDAMENSCGDHIPPQNKTLRGQTSTTYAPNFSFNAPSNPILHPGDEISSLRLCHCCANETVNCYSILLLPVEEQISHLRETKIPLISACQRITTRIGRLDFESNPDKELIMLQEILELVDTSIEMKNNERMADLEMEHFLQANHLVYSSILNCFKMLSSSEIHYLFIFFINKVISLRENSSTLDKLILQLDNTIVDKEIRLRYLSKNYNKFRDACTSLQNESKRNPGKAPFSDKLENIIKASDGQSLPQSCYPEPANSDKGESLSSLSDIPVRNFKVLQRDSSSKTFDVTRKGNKFIIQRNKHP